MAPRRLRNTAKCHCRGDSTDRLSCLPDSVIHHILSFLDTKYSVQTSVLSRRWRCVWKSVPVLNLKDSSFGYSYTQFCRFVDKVLSLRYPLTVNVINYNSDPCEDDEDERRVPFVDGPLVVRILEYAVSHGTRHLNLAMNSDIDPDDFDGFRFPNLSGSTFDRNLEILELSFFCIDKQFASLGFSSLITLKLYPCRFWHGYERGLLDPFCQFPCLKNLVVVDPRHEPDQGQILRISGRQLCNLELLFVCAEGIEICAPNLKYFRFHDVLRSIKFLRLDLPSLDRVEVQLHEIMDFEDFRKKDWVFMFKGFHNVKSLTLCYQISEALFEISEFLGRQASPFTRLETLELPCGRKNIPYKVVNYFLKGSSCANPSIKTY